MTETAGAFQVHDSDTYASMTKRVTNQVLKGSDEEDTPESLAGEITAMVSQKVNEHNIAINTALSEYKKSLKSKGPKKPFPTISLVKWPTSFDLSPQQIASCLAYRHHVALINMAKEDSSGDYDVLALYETEGYNKGIYSTDLDEFADLAREYNYNLTTKDMKEIMSALRSMVPRRSRNMNPDLIPVNNGIYDYRKKKLLPFDPKLVFISKSHVDYVDNAKNPEIINKADGTKWDVVSWISSLSDDKQVVELLWQILGAIIRPNVAWDKSAWLYSTKGNNGKGTLCELMRNLCGAGSYAKVALNDFSQDFMLEPLAHASAIIVDENDVGSYIDKAANLKAVVTGDVITINRKFKSAIAYQFRGFMVQCLNEFPKVKDKSGSFYRRLIFVPMTKNFTGRERKYIKQDYLNRPAVLQYVLYHLLHDTNYYSLIEPDACKAVMNDYQAYNDPIRQFIEELIPSCQWDLLPFSFLYDLYTSWFKRSIPGGKIVSKRSFVKEMRDLFTGKNLEGFTCIGDGQTRTGTKMNVPEPLSLEYHLNYWLNPNVSGSDPLRRTIPQTETRYRGLVRAE